MALGFSGRIDGSMRGALIALGVASMALGSRQCCALLLNDTLPLYLLYYSTTLLLLYDTLLL